MRLRDRRNLSKGRADRVAGLAATGAYVALDVTIMFVDIVGYTAFAELAPPEQVVAELNEFFGLVVPIISDQGGHTNKLLGDGLMAVFGAPDPLADHADRALAAALEVERRRAEHFDGRLRVGMGLNSGRVVAGWMGGGDRLEYAVVGDVVNVAARVEAHTRFTGDAILLTAATAGRLRNNRCVLAPRGTAALKGRAEGVALHAPIARADVGDGVDLDPEVDADAAQLGLPSLSTV